MVMKRCNNGHFYDSDKYGQCPYCGISNIDASKTKRVNGTTKLTYGGHDIDLGEKFNRMLRNRRS